MRKLILALIGLTAIAPFASSQSAAPETVLDRVYTAAQAERGGAVYQASCAKCHEGADVDGPSLEGDPFIDRWREDTLAGLFDFIKTNMPRDSPGKLTEAQYRDILAYLLKANEYPAGDRDLTAEAIESALLVGKDGPKPLPDNAMVRVVGCFSQGSGDAWTLTKAAAPNRTRVGDSTTPAEVKASAAKHLGSGSFHLQNLDDLKPGFKPVSYVGQKVQVKGVLANVPGGRIDVLSFETTGASCAP